MHENSARGGKGCFGITFPHSAASAECELVGGTNKGMEGLAGQTATAIGGWRERLPQLGEGGGGCYDIRCHLPIRRGVSGEWIHGH